jgi:hypothetical protein
LWRNWTSRDQISGNFIAKKILARVHVKLTQVNTHIIAPSDLQKHSHGCVPFQIELQLHNIPDEKEPSMAQVGRSGEQASSPHKSDPPRL